VIAKTSPRDRFAELIIIVACSAGAWWIVAKPFHDRAEAARTILADTRASLDETTVVRAENPERAAAIMTTVSAWSEAHADPLLVGGKLQHAADETQVHIERLSPSEDEAVSSFGALNVSARRFELISTGTARAILDFLDAVDHQPLMVVHAFELAPGDHEGDVIALVHVEVTRIAIADAPADGEDR
jgi:hypothetical protein